MALVYDFVSVDDGLITKSVNGFLPSVAVIPLKKNASDDTQILVKAGDLVKEGQVLARTKDSCIHSSIPGRVEDIVHTQFADGSEGFAAKILLSGSFDYTGKKRRPVDWSGFDSKTLLYIFAEKGVINTFDENIPLNYQIANLHEKSGRILIVRLFSEDPDRLTEGFLTSLYFEKIKTGAEIIAKAMNARGIVFAYDINKGEIDSKLNTLKIPVIAAGFDAKGYPNGFMHELVSNVKENFAGTEFKKIGNRELYTDCITCLNAYNAVVFNEPVINCNIHLTGDCLNSAAVMTVKAGTLLKDLVVQTGNFKRKLGKIVVNGCVTGNSISSLEIPISKEVKSVSFIPENELPDQVTQKCIRCGKCLKICPVSLYPESLYRIYLNKEQKDEHSVLIKQTALLCTECGLCNAVCPSRIPLCQIIKELKQEIKNEK